MARQVLFLQGGGEGGYEADKPMAASLQSALGQEYNVRYPRLISDESKPDFGWLAQIGDNIDNADDNVIIAAHSLGASMLLRYLSENKVGNKIAGIFLLATPFWEGDEDWKQGLKLKNDFAQSLPDVHMFFYQTRDDEEVPYAHFDRYRQMIPGAIFKHFNNGGHQFSNNLAIVASDIMQFQ